MIVLLLLLLLLFDEKNYCCYCYYYYFDLVESTLACCILLEDYSVSHYDGIIEIRLLVILLALKLSSLAKTVLRSELVLLLLLSFFGLIFLKKSTYGESDSSTCSS